MGLLQYVSPTWSHATLSYPIFDLPVCNVHPPDAIEMLEHLRDRHAIQISSLARARSPFRKSHATPPPPIPPPYKLATYKIITPAVAPNPRCKQLERLRHASDKWGFLEDETPEFEEICGEQRAAPTGPLFLNSVISYHPSSRAFYAIGRPAPLPEKGLAAPPQFTRPPREPPPAKVVDELPERMKQAKAAELPITPDSVGFLVLRKGQGKKPESKLSQSASEKRPKR
jgi:hypothetical protein